MALFNLLLWVLCYHSTIWAGRTTDKTKAKERIRITKTQNIAWLSPSAETPNTCNQMFWFQLGSDNRAIHGLAKPEKLHSAISALREVAITSVWIEELKVGSKAWIAIGSKQTNQKLDWCSAPLCRPNFETSGKINSGNIIALNCVISKANRFQMLWLLPSLSQSPVLHFFIAMLIIIFLELVVQGVGENLVRSGFSFLLGSCWFTPGNSAPKFH